MLRGSSLAKLDEKGRLKLPASFRGVLEPKFGSDFFVTSLRGDSVRIYRWTSGCASRRLARVIAESVGDAVQECRELLRTSGPMDAQGRVLVHPLLRERAGIRGRGGARTASFWVWNRSAFQERLQADPVTDTDLGALSDLGI
jgi:MraZ protein